MQSVLQRDFEASIQENELTNSSRRWSVHGVTVEWLTDHPQVRQLIQKMMRGFMPVLDSTRIPQVRIAILSGAHAPVPQDAEILPPSTNEFVDTLAAYNLRTLFARKESLNYYEIAPMGSAVYEISSGLALGTIQQFEAYSAWQITHLYLLIVFLEMMRGQGLFWIHAGTVVDSDHAVLFAGQTGQGKTTTVLSLVEAGFQFLSEDRTFIRILPEGLEVLAFPLDVAVTGRTLEMLPVLQARIDNATQPRGKVRVDPSMLFPNSMIERASPALILFPQVGNQRHTSVQKVEAFNALRRLLPNSLLASNPAITERHFAALTQLVQSVHSYELTLGTALEEIPRVIRELLSAQ